MPKQTIYIAARKYSWSDQFQYAISDTDLTDMYDRDDGTIYKVLEVREIDLPALPSREEMIGAEIDALGRYSKKVMAEAREKVRLIEERIANLRCLEHNPEEDAKS